MNRVFIIIIYFVLFSNSLQAQIIQLVFRYDDFTLKNDSLDEGVVRIFQKCHIPLVLGVIPCDSKGKMILEDKYSFLPILKKYIQNQSIEIAQHGLTHQKFANGEFGKVDKSEQYRRMLMGKDLLDSILQTKVVTFIPPWNAYDNNTLDVMDKTGLKVLSSALCVGQSWSNDHISYFPETIEDFSSLKIVLEHNKGRKGVIVLMFHHYTFNKKYSLDQLNGLLQTINKLSYVKCVTFSQLYNKGEVSDEKRMNANMENNLISKLIHLKGEIQMTSFVNIIRVFNLLFYLFLSLITYFISMRLFSVRKEISLNGEILMGVMILLITVFAVWFHALGPIKILITIVVISILPALILKVKLKISK
jgi:hypothetical protein